MASALPVGFLTSASLVRADATERHVAVLSGAALFPLSHSLSPPSAKVPASALGLRARKTWQCSFLVKAADKPTAGFVAETSDVELPKSAEEAVTRGLELYKERKVRDALRLFRQAMEMNPTPEEAQAALFNKACCHAQREEFVQCQQCLRDALGKYDLRFSVILSDADLASFRGTADFRQLQDEARKGGEDVGSTFRRDLKLIAEVQSPFRGVRKFLYVGLAMAAGISTFFTIPRLIVSLQGGENVPPLLETAGNLAVNVGGGAVLVALYLWEQRKEEEQIARVSRDETLSRLPLRLGSDKTVELVQLRETARPVIVAGTVDMVDKAVKSAERYRKQLMERGVLLVPLVFTQADAAARAAGTAGVAGAAQLAKRRGFGRTAQSEIRTSAEGMAAGDELSDLESRAQAASAKRVAEVERRFKAEPVSPGEWQSWLAAQQEAEGVSPGSDVYIILRLDGRIRKSAKGLPDWPEIINDLPTLDNIISKLER